MHPITLCEKIVIFEKYFSFESKFLHLWENFQLYFLNKVAEISLVLIYTRKVLLIKRVYEKNLISVKNFIFEAKYQTVKIVVLFKSGCKYLAFLQTEMHPLRWFVTILISEKNSILFQITYRNWRKKKIYFSLLLFETVIFYLFGIQKCWATSSSLWECSEFWLFKILEFLI